MQPEPAPEIDWKAESQRFDSVPDLYETYRPGYPEALIDAVIKETHLLPDGKFLEIGTGTGKATEPFARRGYSVLCIEPGKHLAALAAEKFKDFPGIRLVNTTFEDWPEIAGYFDLVISAQAFHWIDKASGFPKIARALKPGGWLAVWWNRQPEDLSEVWLELDRIYRERAPAMWKDPVPFEASIEEPREEIKACGLFGPVKILRFPWSAVFSEEQYLGLLHTYSDHLRLDASTSANLYAGVADVIRRHGGVIQKNYIALLYLAQIPGG